MTIQKTTVLLADDEPLVLRLLHRVLDAHADAVVVGAAQDGLEAIDLWRDLRPDVIVVDHMMPGMTGLEVAERVLREEPTQRIILFTATPLNEVDEAARSLGIAACVAKTDMWSIPELLPRTRVYT